MSPLTAAAARLVCSITERFRLPPPFFVVKG